MLDTVKERLTYYLSQKKVNKSEFGRQIGKSNSYISSMRKSIQPEVIKSIAMKFPDLNTGWLLTGEGEMLRGADVPKQQTPAMPSASLAVELSRDEWVSVPRSVIESMASTIERQQRTIDDLLNKRGNPSASARAECSVGGETTTDEQKAV